jgi:hypothetical protein
VLGINLPTIEIAGLLIGMREAVLALIVAVALYIGLVLLRMHRLSDKPLEKVSPSLTIPPEPVPVLPVEETRPPAEPRKDEVEPAKLERPPPGLADELLLEGMSRELAQLREEVEVMRSELSALRDDMQHELAHLRATQTVSPIYGDAMQMAVAGYDASMIAERCGIARAEAELVVALARSQVQ